MSDSEKTKPELLEELASARQCMEELAQAEARYRTLFEGIVDGVIIHALDGKILDVNHVTCRRLGYSAEALRTMNLHDIVAPEYVKRIGRYVSDVREIGTARFDTEFLRRDGARIPCEVIERSVDYRGTPAIQSVSRDITERKIAETQLQKRARDLEILGKIISAGNRAEDLPSLLEKILGSTLDLMGFDAGGIYLLDEPAGAADLRCAKGLSPDFRKRVERLDIRSEPYAGIFIAGAPLFSDDYGKGRPEADQGEGIASLASVPLFAKDEIVGALNVGSTTPHTFTPEEQEILSTIGRETGTVIARMRAQEELRAKTEELKYVFDNLDEVFFSADAVGKRLLQVSPACERVFGFSPETVLNHPTVWREVIHPKDRQIMDDTRAALQAGKSAAVEYRITRPDGQVRWVQVKIKPTLDAAGNLIRMDGIASDITERKETEEQLKDSEERLKALFEFAPDAYFLTDLKATFVDGNRAAEALSGYRREDLIGKDFFKLGILPPAELPKAAMLLGRNVLGRPTGPDEFNLIRKDGTQIPVEIRTFPVNIKGRGLILGIARDISQRKASEKALRESEEKYKRLFEDSLEAISVTVAGKIADVNPAWLRMHGFQTKDEVIGRDVLDVIHPEDRGILLDRRTMKAEERKPGYQMRDLCKDGSAVDVEVYSNAISLGGQEAILTTLRDITERKRAEDRDARHRRLLEATLTAAWEVTAHSDERGICRAAVEAVRAHLGFDRAGIWLCESPRTMRGVFGTDRRGNLVAEHDQEIAIVAGSAEEAILRGEQKWCVRREHPGGTTAYTREIMRGVGWCALVGLRTPERVLGYIAVDNLMTNRPILEEEAACLALFAQNVANALAAARLGIQLRRAQRIESVGTLAGGVAHNFNNILGIILGNAELLKMTLPGSHEAGEFVQKIITATERAASLAQQLLSVARKASSERSHVSVPSLMENVTQTLRVMLDSSIQVRLNVAPDTGHIVADCADIEQVLLNICLNARDAMPKGGTLTMEACNAELPPQFTDMYEAVQPGSHVMISVADTGTGMDPETLARIFDPFFTTKGPGKGIGLGLATAYGVVTSHGGCIDVESEVGKGSIFRVYLPAASLAAAATPEPPPLPPPEGGNETLLLVDDERNLLESTRRGLEDLGYTVLTADNGREAVEIYRRERGRVAVVLLDFIMPGMDGENTFEELKKVNPEVNVIVASGYDLASRVKSLFHGDVRAFVMKPYRVAHLSRVLRGILDKA